jgi:negative regulator of sigma E activity
MAGQATGTKSNPLALLQQAEKARQTLTYQGTIQCLTTRGTSIPTTAMVQVYCSKGKRLDRLSVENTERAILRLPGTVYSWDGATRTLTQLPQDAKTDEELRFDFKMLPQNYVIEAVGRHKVAGRSARLISVRPRSEDRVSRSYWIDEATKLPLRVEQFDAKGKLELMESYIQISFPKMLDPKLLSPEQFKPQRRVKVPQPAAFASLKAAAQQLSFEPRGLTWLPTGYVFRDVLIHTTPSQSKAAQVRYTDGMLALSLFESKIEVRGGRVQVGMTKQGTAWRRAWVEGDRQYVLTGNVEPEVLAHMQTEMSQERAAKLFATLSRELQVQEEKLRKLRSRGFDGKQMALILSSRQPYDNKEALWVGDAILRGYSQQEIRRLFQIDGRKFERCIKYCGFR